MSATAKKTGRGGNALKYYIMGTELGLSGKMGAWHDPSGIFLRYGVTEGLAIDKQHMKEMLCFARGLNPVVAGAAFNQYGSFDPAGFTEAVWTSATTAERASIAGVLKTAGVSGIYAKSGAETVHERISYLFGQFKVDEVLVDLMKGDKDMERRIQAALEGQKIVIAGAGTDAVFRAIIDNKDTLNASELLQSLWTDDAAKIDEAPKNNDAAKKVSASLCSFGVKIGAGASRNDRAAAIKAAQAKFDVDADDKPAAQEAIERAIMAASRKVKGVDFCLTSGAGMHRSSGDDFTFEAPRDVSVIYAMASPEDRKTIEEGMLLAAKASMAYFNTYAGYTRQKGADGTVFEINCQHAAGLFLDFTARPVSLKGDPHPALKKYLEANRTLGGQEGIFVDPHLHVHCVRPNLVLCADGKYRSHESKYFRVAHQGAQEAAHATLAAYLQDKLGLTIVKEAGKMAFRVAEVNRAHVETMSKRQGAMLERMKELNLGVDFTKISHAMHEKVHHETRAPHLTVSDEDLNDHWHVQGELMGFGPKEVGELLTIKRAQLAEATERNREIHAPLYAEGEKLGFSRTQVAAILRSAPPVGATESVKTLAEMSKTIDAEVAAMAVAMHREKGLSAFYADAYRAEVQRRLTGRLPAEDACRRADRHIAMNMSSFGRFQMREMLATHEWIAMEAATVDLAVHGRHENTVKPRTIADAIARMNDRLGKDGHSMSEEQVQAVKYLLETDRLVTVLEGPAGAGKTTILLPTVEALAASGYTDIKGVALSWSASNTLCSEAKLQSAAAIEMLAYRIKNGKETFTNKTAIIVDEGSLVGSEHFHILIQAAAEAGSRIIVTGDSNQINSVAAGSMMAEILQEKAKVDGVGSFRLSEVRRQKDRADAIAALGLVQKNLPGDLDLEILARISSPDGEEVGQKILGARYLLEWDKKHDRFHLNGTRDQAIAATLTKYTELRAKHGESLLIVALKNESVDKLNIGVRDYLKSTGVLPQDDIKINVRIGKDDKVIGFATGDYIQFRKKTVGTSQEDQVFNRTRAKILDIQGSGDNATIRCQIYAGDKLTDRIIEVSAKSFRDGKLQMEHAYVVTVDAAQGMTVDATVELDEGQGQQRKYVGRTRHRHECHTYGNLDDLHRQAAAHMDADRYTNRNTFTRAMAEEVIVVQWSRSERKTTTLNYINDRDATAGISCLHNSRFTTNATVAKALEDAKRLIAQTRFFEGRQPEARNPSQSSRFQRAFHYSDQTIKVKSSSRADIKVGFAEAKKAWGSVPVCDIKVTGSKTFRTAVSNFVASVTESKNKAKAGIQHAIDALRQRAHDVGYQASRAAKSMFTTADAAMAAEARAAYAATKVPPETQQEGSWAPVQRSGNSGGAPVRRRK